RTRRGPHRDRCSVQARGVAGARRAPGTDRVRRDDRHRCGRAVPGAPLRSRASGRGGRQAAGLSAHRAGEPGARALGHDDAVRGPADEIDALRRRLTRAEGGDGQVAAVVGEAGVGKSRLIHELAHAHRPDGWRVLEATSVSYGQAMSYWPIVELLKQYFAIQDRDHPHEIRDKIRAGVLALDPALAPTVPAFQALLDVPVDDRGWGKLEPPQRRQRTLDAVKRLLLREAREHPLLVIFEDLHWIDRETQSLLDTLAESVGSARLLLLVSYRPE